jgi:hypothetical protein
MKDINKILAKIESYVWENNCNIWTSLIPPPLLLRQLKNNQNQTNTTGAHNFKQFNNTAGWITHPSFASFFVCEMKNNSLQITKKLFNSYNWQSGCPNYQMTAFVFFIFKSAELTGIALIRFLIQRWPSGHPPFLQFPLFCTWLSPNRIFRYARYFIIHFLTKFQKISRCRFLHSKS